MEPTGTTAWTPDSPEPHRLWELLGRPASVTAVGAGGKTTLVHALAAEAAASGASVLLTTTTKMSLEPGLIGDPDAALAARRPGRVVLAGVPGDVKLTPFSDADLDRLHEAFDVVIIEGDGSRRRPFKVPAAHEPVVPAWTDVVLVVAGLSALGRPLGEVCYRVDIASQLLDEPDAATRVLDTEIAANLLRKGYLDNPVLGAARRVVVLHQADDRARQAEGRAITASLPGVEVLLSSTAESERNQR